MDLVVETEAESWREVQEGIAARTVSGYAAAVQHLVDLREVLSAQGREGEFRERVGEIRRMHRLKGNLLVRMDAAGLQGEPALPLLG